jgi:hypothetical protein
MLRSRVLLVASLTAAIAFVAPAGCTSNRGAIVRETRDVAAFTGIRFDGGGTVAIVVGREHSVAIETNEGVMGGVRTEVSGTQLRIWRRFSPRPERFHVDISLPVLTSLQLNGSVRTEVHGAILTPRFELRVAGSSHVAVDEMTVDEFAAKISGSGQLVAGGSAERLILATNGSANMNLGDLEAASARVSIHGSGRLTLDVSEQLEGSISGSGTIQVKRPPKAMNVSTSGSGRMILGEKTDAETPSDDTAAPEEPAES